MKRAYVPAGASRDGPMGFIKLGFGAIKVQPTYIQKCIFEAYDGLQWRVFLDLDTALESVESHSIMTFPVPVSSWKKQFIYVFSVYSSGDNNDSNNKIN